MICFSIFISRVPTNDTTHRRRRAKPPTATQLGPPSIFMRRRVGTDGRSGSIHGACLGVGGRANAGPSRANAGRCRTCLCTAGRAWRYCMADEKAFEPEPMVSASKGDDESIVVAGRGCENSISLLEMKPGGDFELRTSLCPGARVHSRQRGMPRAISSNRFLRSLVSFRRAVRSFSSSMSNARRTYMPRWGGGQMRSRVQGQ